MLIDDFVYCTNQELSKLRPYPNEFLAYYKNKMSYIISKPEFEQAFDKCRKEALEWLESKSGGFDFLKINIDDSMFVKREIELRLLHHFGYMDDIEWEKEQGDSE